MVPALAHSFKRPRESLFSPHEIYAVGGGGATSPPQLLEFGPGPQPGYKNEAYDAATNTWTTRLPLPRSREGLGGAVVGDIFSVAGGDVGARADVAAWAYTP